MSLTVLFAKISWTTLIIILCLRPLINILNYPRLYKLLKYRKYLGIVCGLAAILHVIFYLVGAGGMESFFTNKIYWRLDNFFGWGSLALVLILLPLITSNLWSQKLLKRNWKRVQKLSYPVFILTAIHVALVKRELLEVLVPVLVWITLYITAHLKNKNRRVAPSN